MGSVKTLVADREASVDAKFFVRSDRKASRNFDVTLVDSLLLPKRSELRGVVEVAVKNASSDDDAISVDNLSGIAASLELTKRRSLD